MLDAGKPELAGGQAPRRDRSRPRRLARLGRGGGQGLGDAVFGVQVRLDVFRGQQVHLEDHAGRIGARRPPAEVLGRGNGRQQLAFDVADERGAGLRVQRQHERIDRHAVPFFAEEILQKRRVEVRGGERHHGGLHRLEPGNAGGRDAVERAPLELRVRGQILDVPRLVRHEIGVSLGIHGGRLRFGSQIGGPGRATEDQRARTESDLSPTPGRSIRKAPVHGLRG